jgi:hypothetical protein
LFDTIAAESQRLINEVVQGFMSTLARPEVDLASRVRRHDNGV